MTEQLAPTAAGTQDSIEDDDVRGICPSDLMLHQVGDYEVRVPALRVEPESVTVHVAKGMSYHCEDFEVRRTRWTMDDLQF